VSKRGTINDLASLIDRARGVVGAIDAEPDYLLELGCQLRIGGELKLALSDFMRPLEDQPPFFIGQFAIDSAERRYLDELYKVFFYVRFRARRYRSF
jgi:hypothetical protein